MKPTLFVLAAGMGSRYGGLKQMDGLGPNGETIMDYSIYDALRAGFGKIVFVIRRDFEKEFRDVFTCRFGKDVKVEMVFQAIENIPAGIVYNKERTKPWGTNHAVMMAKEVIKEPFAVINADDFYGKEAYEVMANYLIQLKDTKNHYCMVGYELGNTLSDSGSVSRGVCTTNNEGFLTNVVERTHIEKGTGEALFKDDAGIMQPISYTTPVSMNMWGFTPDYFDHSEKMFIDFLQKNGENLKSEFFIPLVVNNLIQSNVAKVKVLKSKAEWFGVTYKEDRPAVVSKINALVQQGVYPSSLWNK